MHRSIFWQRFIFFILLTLCVSSFVGPPMALVLGFCVSFFFGHPFPTYNDTASKYLLRLSIIGLGFGINLHEAIQIGKEGLMLTIVSIGLTLLFGLLLGRLLKIDRSTSMLVSSGTAICGGSAIATIAPIIQAKNHNVSVSMACIFVLNAIALLIFPLIGRWLDLSQQQFGWWAAIAIHDTSSVVGAAQKYGHKALKIATTVKLERTLWIIPIAIGISLFNKKSTANIRFPYFILGFVGAILLVYYFPQLEQPATTIVWTAKKMLNICLFLIASGLNVATIKKVGAKPFIQALVLWVFISVTSLLMIVFL